MSDYIDSFPLTKWFFENYSSWHHTAFPGGGKNSYSDILRTTHNHLNSNIHNKVAARAALTEKHLYLTDHGPDHIQMVIKRAQHLVAKRDWFQRDINSTIGYSPSIWPYETFLLIMAIHFHDVGNSYGREGHEKRIADVMKDIPTLKVLDGFELGLIARIAACHGGNINGDKDTINHIEAEGKYGDVKYRPQLIAAILRLADELADERSRADNFALLTANNIPEKCLIFHKYASTLTSVGVDSASSEISLQFQLTRDDVCRKFKLKKKEVYLVDYIYERVLKTYREMVYCSRFTRDLDASHHYVAVKIEAYCDTLDFAPIKKIGFRIGDTGYPDDSHGKIEHLAKGFDDSPTGEELADYLNEKCEEHAA